MVIHRQRGQHHKDLVLACAWLSARVSLSGVYFDNSMLSLKFACGALLS